MRGVVFEDSNANGIPDPGESGLPGIAVSDQSSVVTTQGDGSYELAAAPEAGVVFVSVPDGWAAEGLFWKSLKNDTAEQRADFPLRRRPTSAEFMFVHASDTHVQASSLPRLRRLREKVAEIRPAFVLITGDLVRDALRVGEEEARGYYELFMAELARFPVPVWTAPGNHENFGIERQRSGVTTDHPLYGKKMYQHYLGPNYYSFTWGGVRFVGLDTVDIDDQWYYGHVDAAQLKWLGRDVAAAAPATTVVTFNHIPLATAVEGLAGYTEDSPAPTVIRVDGKPQFRHVVSNTADLLQILKPFHLEIALGGHMHVRESLVYEADGRQIRFHQAAAIVGPSKVASIAMTSGFTLYRVKDGRVDNGTFVPLEP